MRYFANTQTHTSGHMADDSKKKKKTSCSEFFVKYESFTNTKVEIILSFIPSQVNSSWRIYLKREKQKSLQQIEKLIFELSTHFFQH